MAAVVPYIGTWIETLLFEQQWRAFGVVPYIGTWIETDTPISPYYGALSYLI